VPVSTARSSIVVTSANMRSRPVTARRQTPSQSASSAERVEVISDLMLSDVGLTLDPLLPVQREAVTCDREPLLVVGAAGTGKTRALEGRFVRFVEQGCGPERVLLLTPSGARADATRARLERALERGYDELFVMWPVELASLILSGAGPGLDPLEPVLGPAERFAMLLERIDRLSLERHDFGGSANALLAGFIRRIDRLKANLVGAERYARWASGLPESDAEVEREFAEVYRAHDEMLEWCANGRPPPTGSSTCSWMTRTTSTWPRRR